MNTDGERWARPVTALLFLLVVAGLAVGACAFGPYLEREHRRLEPWKVPLVWLGLGLALLWFLQFCAAHGLAGRAVRPPPAGGEGLGRAWWLALVTILAAMAADAWMAVRCLWDEQAGYAAAVRVPGQVNAVQRRDFPKNVRYVLRCTYQDRAGNVRQSRFTLRDQADGGLPAGLPPAVAAAIRAGRVPFPVEVAYDPALPGRDWLAGAGWDDNDRLHYFSLAILFFQALTLPLFMIALSKYKQRTGEYPWWYDLHKAYPALIAAAFLLLFGVIELTVHVRR
jgi:hypothetical protein